MYVEQILVEFVEGKMTIEEFKTLFLTNPSIEHFLKNDPNIQEDTYVGDNTYDYIHQEGQDRNGNKDGWKA